MRRRFPLCVLGLLLGLTRPLCAQHFDDTYEPRLAKPAYVRGSGPVVGIDEAHLNNVADGRWKPLVKLLREDGYRVEAFTTKFTPESLKKVQVLIVANALAEANKSDWKPGQPAQQNKWALPTYSAFEQSEIDAVETWVKDGGSLLLLAGHMPWPGAAEKLAERFDVIFQNGFAFPIDPKSGEVRLEMGTNADERVGRSTLIEHPVFAGRSPREVVTKLERSRGMQAFRLRPGGNARPLVALEGRWILLLPEIPWQFSEKTARIRADGMITAAATAVGKGRALLLGDNARAFSATLLPPNRTPFGINNPDVHNQQFVLNMMHWLSGLLPAD
jgi:hypothetical protein